MNNDINIDPKDIMSRPDASITDGEVIRQIAMYDIENPGSDITSKIDPSFEVLGMYPYVHQIHNIIPDPIKKMYNDKRLNLTMVRYMMDPNVLNMYLFGSHVYGTANENSDRDVILVVREWFDSKDIDVHVYTVEQFELAIRRHDIQALECVFLAEEFVFKNEYDIDDFVLDKYMLRTSISTITSNSWVKGKKKLIVAGDYDQYLAIKSVFHSLRILDFGIQIATNGRIDDYTSMNYVMEDLYKLSEQYKREELWQKIDDKYRKVFNAKTTQFKLLAPKDLKEKDLKTQLKNILNRYGCDNDTMFDEIFNLIQK